MTPLTYFTISMIMIFVIYNFVYKNDVLNLTTTKIKADDEHFYIVRKSKFSDTTQTEAANIISKVIYTVNTIVKYMCENDLPTSEIAYRLQYRWKNTVVREIAAHEDTAAYTVNKGEEMRLCIRKEDGTFHDFNHLAFVVLHELGHMMSISYGHDEEFQSNFDAVIHIASSIGLYTPEDFDKNPIVYCGIKVTSSPCFWGTGECDNLDKPTLEYETEKPINCGES